ncbi:COP9 signalosome (CSN) subunit [Phlyctochytrium bullatum]|nr:COP9 signalosome (CSN) subunit [Phlyctochytrium bullatum]
MFTVTKIKSPAVRLNGLVNDIQSKLQEEDGESVGHIFRIHNEEALAPLLELKQINLASNLIKSLKSADLPELDKYPIGHVVTFRYYMGVLAFFNEEYARADEELTYAMRHCRTQGPDPELYANNRKMILNYLVPTRLISGKIPKPELYDKYPSVKDTYRDIINATISGNLSLFDETLESHQRDIIVHGTYLTIERCRFLCFRNLAKKVWLCKGKATRLEFSNFLRAVKVAGCHDIDMDEIECMLANLIDKDQG